jgi:glyoxylase I family protein
MAVEGLDELAKQLSEAGTAISKSRSGHNAIFCRDPDGNGVELISMD